MDLAAVLREVIGRSTRKWVYPRRLPHIFGGASIFVTPSAGLKYLFRSISRIDPDLLRNVLELVRPNDIVWDIGANVGLFAFSAAARAGPGGNVYAFEPDLWLVQILRRSAAIQPKASAPVSIVPSAVASNISLRSFAIASRSRASNALVGYGYGQMRAIDEVQTVVALNLDWLGSHLEPPDVIKCDVEGSEVEVFFGQLKILREIRPIIICEISETTSEQMTDIFVKERYRIFDGEKPLSRNSEVDRATWNTIAIPEERLMHYIIDSPSRGP